jgi:hypothetical protein
MKGKLLATAAALALTISVPAFAQSGSNSPGMSGGSSGSGAGQGMGGSQGTPQNREQDHGIKSGQTEKGKGSMSREKSTSKGSESKEKNAQSGSERSKERMSGKENEKSKTRSSERDRDNDRSKSARDRDHDKNTKSSDRDRDRNASDRDKNRDRASDRDRDRNRGSADKGSKSGTNVTLNSSQKTKISTTIRSAHVEPLRNVNFSVRVGVVVPSSVHFHTLPATIVEIVPEYRGYYYVVVEDEIVIIEPRTRKIVTVIEYQHASRDHKARTHLSSSDRTVIKRQTARVHQPAAHVSERYVVGETVPADVDIYDMPATIYTEVPAVRSYRYVRSDRGVVLVDPAQRRVVDVID